MAVVRQCLNRQICQFVFGCKMTIPPADHHVAVDTRQQGCVMMGLETG